MWRDFQDDDCAFLAGAVAYQIFFALLPFLLLVVGVFGFFLEARDVRREVESLLRDVLPVVAVPRFIDQLTNGRVASIGLGLVGTVWAATALHAALDSALQAVYGRAPKASFVRSKLAALGFAGLLGLLALLSFAFSFVIQVLSDSLGAVIIGRSQRATIELASPLFGLAMGFALFFVVYRIVPRERQPLSSLLVGSVIAAVLWELAKFAFALLSRRIGVFQAYGALALAAGLLTWIYLTAVIALLGAEIIKAHAAARAKAVT